MRRAVLLAMLAAAAPIAIGAQARPVLHIRAVLTDATGPPTPVARYALLISETPQTTETRRVLTGVDGTARVSLRPGTYIVESDQPLVVQGKPYYWRQTVVIAAGGDSSLDLTLENAVPDLSPPEAATASAPVAIDTTRLRRQWLDSVFEVWTPTAHASGFLVDALGLIVTNQRVVGDATAVEVQLSRSSKVAGIVVEADRERDVAVIRVNPASVASLAPVPLGCPRRATPIAAGDELFALAAPLRGRRQTSSAPTHRRSRPI
jgi:S1-C subfamily serine protease